MRTSVHHLLCALSATSPQEVALTKHLPTCDSTDTPPARAGMAVTGDASAFTTAR